MLAVQGITLGYGGNPYGPAGTGKTESVKALGQALARQVCVTAFPYPGLALDPAFSSVNT